MDKGLVFFTLAGVLLWLILDDFFGTGKVQKFAAFLTPDLSLGNIAKNVGDSATKKANSDAADYVINHAGDSAGVMVGNSSLWWNWFK